MGILSVGALAIASRRANAVGAVRLTCAPEGLEIELVRAAPFARGFAPGAVAEEVIFRAPYAAVRGLVREGRLLHLALDPRVVTPHNRFALARFSTDPALVLAGAYAARARARVAAWALPGPIGLAAAIGAPAQLANGALGRVSFGLIVAAIAAVAFRELLAWRTWGGPASDTLRDAFEGELARHLGLEPARAHVEVPVDLASLDVDADEAPARVPRGLWIAIPVAVVAVAAMALFHRVTSIEPAREPLAVAVAPPPASAVAPLPKLAPCTCLRADASVWQNGLPVLGVLVFRGEADGAAPVEATVDARGRGRYEFDVAAVNDSSKSVRDVRITLTFARRNKRGARVGATDRGLFWEGELLPGRAVKWHVKAPGTEMRVDASVSGTLTDTGLDPAPADAAFELTHSRWRAVRIEGAKILAYERDPRAAAVVESLAAGATPSEAPILASLARASAPFFACEVGLDADASEAAGASTASACLFNGTTSEATSLTLVDLARHAEIPVPLAVPAHEGGRVTWPSASAPGELEIRLR